MTGVKYGGIRQLHYLHVNPLSKWLRRAKVPYMGGFGSFKHTCKGLFTKFVNQHPVLDRQGIIPDFMLDATSIDFP